MSVNSVNCSISTAPSSPGRKSCCSNISEDFYFSEPTSPTHFCSQLLQSSVSDSDSGKNVTRAVNRIVLEEDRNEYLTSQDPKISKGMKALNGGDDHVSSNTSFEFEFGSIYSEMAGDQPFAEELFLNGQIRPLDQQIKSEYIVSPCPPLSSGSKIRLVNAPANEDEYNVIHSASKSKDHKEYTTKIRKGRSNSLPNFLWEKPVKEDRIRQEMKDASKMKAESQRASKRWRLKDFLDRTSSGRKKEKDRLWRLPSLNIPPAGQAQKHSMKKSNLFYDQSTNSALKPTACSRYDETKIILESPAGGNRFTMSDGTSASAYSTQKLHYKENNRRSYTRGLLGCLMNGLTRNLHPFSSI